MKLQDIRNEFQKGSLDFKDLNANPFLQFKHWMDDAIKWNPEPTAFTLSTVSSDGQPSSRVVLLKESTEEGFVFYTNYASRKGAQIEENPKVGMTFFWEKLERQVHIEGVASKLSAKDCDDYFYSRPIESQIGAILSKQSQPLRSKKELMTQFEQLKAEGAKPERPSTWGGYLIKPSRIEFWQGGKYRLHDRFAYTLEGHIWTINQLNP